MASSVKPLFLAAMVISSLLYRGDTQLIGHQAGDLAAAGGILAGHCDDNGFHRFHLAIESHSRMLRTGKSIRHTFPCTLQYTEIRGLRKGWGEVFSLFHKADTPLLWELTAAKGGRRLRAARPLAGEPQ